MVDVEFLVKIKTTQCQDCGKFLHSCKNSILKHKCERYTANTTHK